MRSTVGSLAFAALVLGCSAPAAPADVTAPADSGVLLDDGALDAATDDIVDAAPQDATRTDAATAQTTTTMISAMMGGEAQSADGLFRLHVFPGGIESNTTISITRVAYADLPAEVRAANPVGGAVYSVEPDGLRFTGPGAYAWFHFASIPAGVVTAGAPPRYAQLQLVAQPRAGGPIEPYPRAQTHYDVTARSLDVVGQPEHLSLQFVTDSAGSSIRGDLHGEEPHYVGDTWWATDFEFSIARETRVLGRSYLLDEAFIAVSGGPSMHVIGRTIDEFTSEELSTLTFDGDAERWAPVNRVWRRVRLPPVLDETVLFRPRAPSFSCHSAGVGSPTIQGQGRYPVSVGTYTSSIIGLSERTTCLPPPVGRVSIVELARAVRDDGTLTTTPPTTTAEATWRASSATTAVLANREWFVVTQRTSDPPAAGPATITATNSGATMTATRDAAGQYTCAFDSVSNWRPDAPTRFGTGADARDVTPPSRPAFSFGPVAGLDTEIRPEPGTPPLTVEVCGTGFWRCGAESARCFFRTIDPSATAVTVREGFEATATRCGVSVDELIARDFYISVTARNEETVSLGGVPTRVSTGYGTQINGRDLLATCSGARPTFGRGRCVNLATDPMNCGACGRTGTEVCDGLDNDCDGVVDEGCPTSITWPGGINETSPLLGDTMSPTDGLSTAGCTYTNPLIGLCGTINTDGTIRSLRATCGITSLITDRSFTPFRYEIDVVEVAPAGGCESGSGGGPSGGTAFSLRCPPGMVIDGITGVSGAPGRIRQIAPRCSQWVVAQDVTQRWVIRRGMRASSIPASAGTAGGSMFTWTVPDDASTDNPGAIRNVRTRYRLGLVDPGVYWIQAMGIAPSLR